MPDQPGEYIIVEHKGSGMNGHVFRAHSDELRRDIAVKIIPKQNLGPNWKQEFQKANMIERDFDIPSIANLALRGKL